MATTERPRNFRDLTGYRYGRLAVVEYVGRGERGHSSRWKIRCDCGVEKVVWASSLTSGRTRSCGCLGRERRREANTTHGLSKHPAFKHWQGMMDRCTNQKVRNWHNYGGRGIKVHPDWFDPRNFIAAVGIPPFERASLDRIDNNGDYAPGNVRWATHTQQLRNTRHNRILECDGQARCVTEWAEITGIPAGTIRARLRMGWDNRRILYTPVDIKRQPKWKRNASSS